jgi:hypothetical protein
MTAPIKSRLPWIAALVAAWSDGRKGGLLGA